MHRSMFKLLIAFALLNATQGALMCPLCGSSDKVPARWDYPISQVPFITCRDIFFRLAAMKSTDDQCGVQQDLYQAVCCDEELPPGWDIDPKTPPPDTDTAEVGDQPMCRICGTDEFPGLPDVSISARYVGTYTCSELYYRGRNQWISGFMCGPLQDYAYDKCGCGPYNPNSNTQPPNPTPTKAPTHQPTRPPTTAPTRQPTPSPTPSPTESPTSAPGFGTRKKAPVLDKNQHRLPRPSAYGGNRGHRGLWSRMFSDATEASPVEA
eukprot:scaffold1559_cov114-Cylindrotheca_fusiformis.AAC.8